MLAMMTKTTMYNEAGSVAKLQQISAVILLHSTFVAANVVVISVVRLLL